MRVVFFLSCCVLSNSACSYDVLSRDVVMRSALVDGDVSTTAGDAAPTS